VTHRRQALGNRRSQSGLDVLDQPIMTLDASWRTRRERTDDDPGLRRRSTREDRVSPVVYESVRPMVRYTVGRETENNSPRSEIVYSPVSCILFSSRCCFGDSFG